MRSKKSSSVIMEGRKPLDEIDTLQDRYTELERHVSRLISILIGNGTIPKDAIHPERITDVGFSDHPKSNDP